MGSRVRIPEVAQIMDTTKVRRVIRWVGLGLVILFAISMVILSSDPVYQEQKSVESGRIARSAEILNQCLASAEKGIVARSHCDVTIRKCLDETKGTADDLEYCRWGQPWAQ